MLEISNKYHFVNKQTKNCIMKYILIINNYLLSKSDAYDIIEINQELSRKESAPLGNFGVSKFKDSFVFLSGDSSFFLSI